MGCNCGKKKPVRPSKEQVQKQQKKQPDQPRNGSAGGGDGKQEFKLTMSSGRSITYGSRLEAEAANIRAGRSGSIRPV